MKCMSRSTLGVVIGALNILGYIIASIVVIVGLIQVNLVKEERAKHDESLTTYSSDPFGLWDEDDDLYNDRQKEAVLDAVIELSNTMFVIILIIFLTMSIISGLLIMGIVKRRHSLMAPWLILSGIWFACSCLRAVVVILGAIAAGHSIGEVLLTLLFACLILGLHAIILYPIYTLYKDIRNKNNALSGHIVTVPQVGFTNAYSAPPAYYSPVQEKAPPTYYSAIPAKSLN